MGRPGSMCAGPDGARPRPRRRVTPSLLLTALASLLAGCGAGGSPGGAGTTTTPGGGTADLHAPASGFGGYELDAAVHEISAEWRVPAILPGSPAGRASTWVGAQSEAGGFVQLGTIEVAVARAPAAAGSGGAGRSSATGTTVPAGGGDTAPFYEAFWSDTQRHFLAQYLGRLAAGALVVATMKQSEHGWTLHFRDATAGWSRTLTAAQSPGSTFTRAEWLQEDPVPTLSSYVDGPYPLTATVAFRDLALDGARPDLSFLDGTALASPNGICLVPSPLAGDAFSMHRPPAAPCDYLEGTAALDAAASRFEAAIAGGGAVAARDGADLVAALLAFDRRLSARRWGAASRPVAAIRAHDALLVADLRAWLSARGASAVAALRGYYAAASVDAGLSDAARAALGLPPLH